MQSILNMDTIIGGIHIDQERESHSKEVILFTLI